MCIFMRYTETNVVFAEVPGEVTLAVNISGCPVRCPGCHSPWLWKDAGTQLTEDVLLDLVRRADGITCVALMGGDADPRGVAYLLMAVKDAFPGMKTCWYSGRDFATAKRYIGPLALDYLKVGPYDEAYGPLDSPSTNQRMYRILRVPGIDDTITFKYEDMTSLFWKNQKS